jgi:transposase
MQFDLSAYTLIGPAGALDVSQEDDEILHKLAMLIEGECEGLGATAAAAKYGYSKQRYYQLLIAFRQGGCLALLSRKPGPKAPSRRTPDVIREVIRHRFLNPTASADVIAQKIRQTGSAVAARSVSRVLQQYGLQKKTLRISANGSADG